MAAKAKTTQVSDDDLEDEFDVGPGAERIAPKVDLRRKAKEIRSKPGAIDPIAAAEAAMEDMNATFSGWMVTEADKLAAMWKACDDADYSQEARTTLFRAAHDVKGQAATLGFPAAGRVAGSLCFLLDGVKNPDRLPRELVRQHSLAVRAIAQESIQNVPNAVADKLADKLQAVTEEFVNSLR